MYNVTYPKREDPAFRVSVRVFTVEHRRFIDRVVLATQQFYLFESYLSEWNRGWRIVDRILVDRCRMRVKTRRSWIGQKFENRSERSKQREISRCKSFNSGWSNWMKSKNGATVVMGPLANIWRLNKRQIHVAMASCVWLLISLPLFLVSCSRRLQVFELEKYFLGSSTSRRSRIKILQLASPLCVSRHGLDA